MIVFPRNWKKDYRHEQLQDNCNHSIDKIIEILREILVKINIRRLAYSGGIDSTIILALLSEIYPEVHTFTISNREDHPDVIFARKGSDIYGSIHHEFICEDMSGKDGDEAVKKLFELSKTGSMICCDGIDEYMCGYYAHMKDRDYQTYEYFLERLTPDHLEPLDANSGKCEVYLPFLDDELVKIYQSIPFEEKVIERKIITKQIARKLAIDESIIDRNKYGFCDAFIKCNK